MSGGQPTVSTCDDRVSDSGVREDANSGSTGAEDDAAVKSADTAPRNFQEIWTHKYPWLRYAPTENKNVLWSM